MDTASWNGYLKKGESDKPPLIEIHEPAGLFSTDRVGRWPPVWGGL